MNVVFTSAGRRVELLRSFRRAYEELGIEGRLVAVDMDPLAAALQVADRVHLVPPFSDPGYTEQLAEICRREEASLLVPLIDDEMPVLVRNRAMLEATGARPLLLEEEAFRHTADKLSTHSFFERIGVATPETWPGHRALEEDLTFPLFVKPRYGSGGKGTFKVRNRRELEFFVAFVADAIVQEFLPGAEVTSDVLCDAAGTVRAVVSRRRIEVRAGEVSKGVTVVDEAVLKGCVAIAEGLGATCPITVQCMFRDGAPYFTEVNPRFGGGVPLALAAGAPLPQWLLATEIDPDYRTPPLGSYAAGVYFTRFDEAFVLDADQVEGRARGRL